MKSIVGFFLSFLLQGCLSHSTDDSSSVKIIKGTKLTLGSQPWTMKITFPNDPTNFCTATFVSDNTMLTASHCADRHPTITLEEMGNINSVSIHYYPFRCIVCGIEDKNDIAVVIFPARTSKKFVSIAKRAPKKGDKVTMIGYGSCDNQFPGDRNLRQRCIGENVIDAIASDTTISTNEKNGVVLTKGDSGGPLFNEDNQIIGVANATSGVGSRHVNLLSTDNLKWLKSVVKTTDAKICGLDGLVCK